jgi:hypothetical protein
VRVYQFRHFGIFGKVVHYLLGEDAGEGVNVVDVGTAAGAAADGAACGVAVGVGVAAGASSVMPDCRTELVPLMNGSERHNATSMKAAAAPMVSFASNVCVPRGPKAVLDTELENRAPASALPGCKRTATIKMTQDRINNP